jgi:hypothetical protein
VGGGDPLLRHVSAIVVVEVVVHLEPDGVRFPERRLIAMNHCP